MENETTFNFMNCDRPYKPKDLTKVTQKILTGVSRLLMCKHTNDNFNIQDYVCRVN